MKRRENRDREGVFDSLIGPWKVRHRRLKTVLSRSPDWYEFDGVSVARRLPQGPSGELGALEARGDVQGLTLRLRGPGSRPSSIYWEMSGCKTFEEPTEWMNGDATPDGADAAGDPRPALLVRSRWTKISNRLCRWVQAVSADGGATWETNWVVEFTRPPGA